MSGVENRFKMQLFLGLKGSPLVGVRIVNFVPPDLHTVDPAAENCPSPQASQALEPFRGWNFPPGQSAQKACPVRWNRPISQAKHEVRVSAAWNRPAGQSTQSVFTEDVAFPARNFPGAHLRTLVHEVERLPG